MTPHPPLVSIGLPVFNGERYLAAAIESILAQTIGDFEVILSDNASTDDTPAIAARFVERDPRIRYFRQAHNLGAAPNFNFTVHQARGQYFKWAAHDDIIAPDFLEICLDVLEADPAVVVAMTKAHIIDADGRSVEDYAIDVRSDDPKADQRFYEMTREFVKTVRDSLGDAHGTTVFFQIPETRRILRDAAFWDIYYEHCSYFTAGSLGRLFRNCGFKVDRLWSGYDDQYLMIEARPADGTGAPAHDREEPVAVLASEVDDFARRRGALRADWRRVLGEAESAGKRIVLWGGGSKAVAFLCSLDNASCILGAVDINPHKHGTYLAGVGHRILAPNELREIRPDIVIVMNPVYVDEITASLKALSLEPTLYPIDAPTSAVAR